MLSNSFTKPIIKYVGISSHCDKHFKHGGSKREGIIEMVEMLNTRYFPFSGKQPKKKNYFSKTFFEPFN